MTNVLERHSDNIRKAIQYIDEKLRETPGSSVQRHLSDAGARFNLSPKDVEFLQQFFKGHQPTKSREDTGAT